MTRKKLLSVLANSQKKSENPENSQVVPSPEVKNIEILSLGKKGDRVKNLQNFLKKEGYFSGVSTGYFGPRTANVLLEFQKTHKLVGSSSDSGAGV